MDPSMTAEEEAPKDPGAFKPHASVTDNEILGESAFPFPVNSPGNALARVQWVHAPAVLWDITFCTR